MAIQFRLREIMKKQSLTYQQVSVGANVSVNTLYKINAGKQRMIGIGVIERLTDFLNCEPGELIVRVK